MFAYRRVFAYKYIRFRVQVQAYDNFAIASATFTVTVNIFRIFVLVNDWWSNSSEGVKPDF